MNELPIACTLDAAGRARRLDGFTAVAEESMLGFELTERGTTIHFLREAEGQLRALAAAEAECCPFLEFEIRGDGETLVVDVSGPEMARPLILDLFGLAGT